MTGPLATLLRSRSIASHAIAAARWCHQSVEEDTVSGISLTKLFLGFAAGAIAVVTAHKIIDYVLYTAGIFPRVRWSISPAAIHRGAANRQRCVLGRTVGGSFCANHRQSPGGNLTVKGLIFGILGPAILGVFILVPLITGRFPLFFGVDPQLLGSVVLILAGFGAAMGWIYGLLTART